jgi:hypothetical protein
MNPEPARIFFAFPAFWQDWRVARADAVTLGSERSPD